MKSEYPVKTAARNNRIIWLTMLVAVLVGIIFGQIAFAQEKVTLTTPVQSSTGVSEFRVASLHLNRQSSVVRAIFAEVSPGTLTFLVTGRTMTCEYLGAPADAMMIALNKANLSSSCAQAPDCSLERRVVKTCQEDGKLPPGTISGTPQNPDDAQPTKAGGQQ